MPAKFTTSFPSGAIHGVVKGALTVLRIRPLGVVYMSGGHAGGSVRRQECRRAVGGGSDGQAAPARRSQVAWACPDSVDTCVMLLAPSARSAARKQRG